MLKLTACIEAANTWRQYKGNWSTYYERTSHGYRYFLQRKEPRNKT